MRKRRQGTKIFTLVELLVVVAVIAILAALLLPALNSARTLGKRTFCMGNQKQCGCAILSYASDCSFYIAADTSGSTPAWTWEAPYGSYSSWNFLLGYFGYLSFPAGAPKTNMAQKISYCPSQARERGATGPFTNNVYGRTSLRGGYSQWVDFVHLNKVANPSGTELLVDSVCVNSGSLNYGIQVWRLLNAHGYVWHLRHLNQCNVLFCDGHVNGYKMSDIAPLVGLYCDTNYWNGPFSP